MCVFVGPTFGVGVCCVSNTSGYAQARRTRYRAALPIANEDWGEFFSHLNGGGGGAHFSDLMQIQPTAVTSKT